jgi:hypothetical protein
MQSVQQVDHSDGAHSRLGRWRSRAFNRGARLLGRRDRLERSPGPRRLLTGAAASKSSQDELQHQAVAAALAAAIRDTAADEPLGIGLYGAWGQGKTTIGELLRTELKAELEDGRYVFVRIDAWKYAHEGEPQPLRRHFLIAAYEAARLERKALELKRLFGAEFSGSLGSARSPLRKSFRLTFWELWVLLLVAAAIVGLVGGAGKTIHWLKHWGHYVAVLGIGGALVTAIVGVVRDRFRVTAKIDPFGSVEEFDEQLSQLIEKDARTLDQRPVERFIFLIDDLDRCHDRLVIEAIETLQAFFGRARCVYIVAADREQLRRAVRHKSAGPAGVEATASVIPSDESFLEKIFQVTVDVPPPFAVTLAEYARRLIPGTAIADIANDGSAEELETVLYYLIHPELRSPRQVRVVLNEFSMALSIASQRQRAPKAHLGHQPLTENKALLAKFVVLRLHFPWFYELLFTRPELLISAQEWLDALSIHSEVAPDDRQAWERVEEAAGAAAGEQAQFEAGAEPEASDSDANPTTTLAEEQSKRIGERSKLLLGALEDYLSRTAETRVIDPVQVEEFIYLRGREEFENLPGADGRALRRAIDSGVVSAIDDLGSRTPGLVPAALAAAVSRLGETRGVEERNVRRAALALVRHVGDEVLALDGLRVAEALYRDDFRLDETMGRDDLVATRRLLPFLDRAGLAALIDHGGVSEAHDLLALARRLRALDAEELWSRALAKVHGSPLLLAELAKHSSELATDDAAFVFDQTLATVEPTICAPALWRDEGVEVVSVDEHDLVVRDAEGDEIIFAIPEPLLPAALELAAGSTNRVVAFADPSNTWVLTAVENAEGQLISVAGPPVISDEVRVAAFALVDGLAMVGEVSANRLAPLLDWVYPRAGDWASGLRLIAAAVRRGRWTDADTVSRSIMEALETAVTQLASLSAEPRVEVASAALALAGAATCLPVRTVRSLSRQMTTHLASLVPAAAVAERTRLAHDLHRARKAFPRRATAERVAEALPAGFAERLQIITAVVEPVHRDEALGLYVKDVTAMGAQPVSDDSAARTRAERLLLAYLERVEAIAAQRTTKEGRKLLARLPALSVPSYAGRAVRLFEQLKLDVAPSPEFLALAAGASSLTLVATCDLLVRTSRTGEAELDAVLRGIGWSASRGEKLPRVVDEFQRSFQARIPRLEQHARIAKLLGWREAEAAGGEHVLPQLLETAVQLLKRDPKRAATRMELAEGWGKASQARRSQAANGYCLLLEAVRSEEQLLAVVASALRFFGGRPVEKANMRRAAYSAIERIYKRNLPTEEARGVLVRAMSELDWAGPPSKPAPVKIRKLLG